MDHAGIGGRPGQLRPQGVGAGNGFMSAGTQDLWQSRAVEALQTMPGLMADGVRTFEVWGRSKYRQRIVSEMKTRHLPPFEYFPGNQPEGG